VAAVFGVADERQQEKFADTIEMASATASGLVNHSK
jgi:hypothetical protein